MEADKESKGSGFGILFLIGLALLVWVGHNVFCAYEWEIKGWVADFQADISTFFRVIFTGRK